MATAKKYYKKLEEYKKLLKEKDACISGRDKYFFFKRLDVYSEHTQYNAIKMFIKLCQYGLIPPAGEYDPNDEYLIEKLVNLIKNETQAKSTRLHKLHIIRVVYRLMGRQPPNILAKEVIHDAVETISDISERKYFTEGEVEKIINSAVSLYNDPDLKTFKISNDEFPREFMLSLIFLTTIYGLRRVEISNLNANMLDEEGGYIFIPSAKGSVRRKQLIPPSLTWFIPILKTAIEWNTTADYNIRNINALFRIVKDYAGIQVKANIHGIRKTLASYLIKNGVDEPFVNDFLRWKAHGTMLEYYANLDPTFVDIKIFEKHPFIGVWENKKREFQT